MSQDFAWIYHISGTAETVAAGATVILNTIANQPAGSNISLNAATGVVTVASSGFYQVSYGILQDVALTNIKVSLQVNGAIQANQQFTSSFAGGTLTMLSLTTVVHLTAASNTLQIVNSGGAGWTLNSTDASVTGVSSFMTIVKLQ